MPHNYKLTIVWNDNTEEEVWCYSWNMRTSGYLVICINNVTRTFRHIPLTSIKEWKQG